MRTQVPQRRKTSKNMVESQRNSPLAELKYEQERMNAKKQAPDAHLFRSKKYSTSARRKGVYNPMIHLTQEMHKACHLEMLEAQAEDLD